MEYDSNCRRNRMNGSAGGWPRPMLAAIVAVIVCIGGWTATASADVVGGIVIDNYSTHQGGGLGGVQLQMHFELDPAFFEQDCCEVDDLRWLQRVTVGIAIPPLTTNPNESLIDPRMGQPIGPPLGTGDALPYYDYTYPNANLTSGQENLGAGPHFIDVPNVPLVHGQSVMFETVVVCIHGDLDDVLCILGGVSWGFTITDAGGGNFNINPAPVTQLADSAALRANFQAALDNDFPGWTMEAMEDCCEVPLELVVVPEPSSSLALLVIGGAAMIRRRQATDRRIAA